MDRQNKCGHVYRFNAEYVCELSVGHSGGHSMCNELIQWVRDEVLDRNDDPEVTAKKANE